MNKEELMESWENFTEKNDFKLNPDEWHVKKAVPLQAEGQNKGK